ncbi:hypothetical protein GIB67_004741 [Kingdonia uniflora]|uniref:Protein kinase domain-containing protein n=1 Tax=Kingdonia uniflora TaxID=39325 RepID=A0A7J7NQX7_9MAGN|nr:hypothetical protein GIB67_004741 [Kingdonia uniflora]
MKPTLLLLLLLSLSTIFAQINQTQLEIKALTSFKLNLHDPLGAFNEWDSTTPSAPCDWRGVLCYNNRVTELRLPRLQLAGQLTPQLANLRELRKLSLRSNSLNGTIPSSLSKCTRLRAIFFQYNLFSGEFPPEIGNLTALQVLNVAQNGFSGGISGSSLPVKLRYLDLSSNGFSGEVPRNFSALLELKFLNLAFNEFSGGVPPSFGELQKLEYLWLDWNRLEGTLPSALANCSSLMHFSVQGNGFRGVIPSAIGELPRLEVLTLSRNSLSGSIPSSLFSNGSMFSPPSLRIVQLGFNKFTDIVLPVGGAKDSFFSVLQVLDLQSNRIHGGFPSWLTNVTTLSVLDLSENSFSGTVPIEIGNLARLEELRMANNSLSGEVPGIIQRLSSLWILDLEGNMFSGEIPGFFRRLTGLKTLSLGENQFSGSIPASLGTLSELQTLNLRENNLTGVVPQELLQLRNLTVLNLGGNKFTGKIPSNIGDLRGLGVLNLSNSGFSGSIPSSIGNLLHLSSLDLSHQSLSGEVPIELSGLPNLQIISLEENKLSGDVPEGFSSLSGLRFLNLSANNFTGDIPATYGYLRSLIVLSLSRNHISGIIEPELGNCSNLEVLQLSSNRLTGEIPYDLSRLSHLKVLDLSENNLSGNITDSLSKLSNLTFLNLSVNNLSGEIPGNLIGIVGLTYLNVSRNNLEGEIPKSLGLRFKDQSVFAMNPGLCGDPLVTQCASESKAKKKKKIKKLILLIAVALGGALLVSLCCCCYIYSLLRWRKQLREAGAGEKKRTSPNRTSSSVEGENGGPKLVMFNNKFTYAETLEATRQFDEENVLSRGRYGLLFKACFNDGTVLAIRRLPDGTLEQGNFRKEAELLGKIKHRNLTVLRGYFPGPPNGRLLVYDYMPNGNLATLLQEASHQDGHVLNWPMRHLIALGVGRGLAFLHNASIIHGDIKPQNVLFDADFEAHLSDFGLERLTTATSTTTPIEAASTSAIPVGTIGYVSPEATLTGQVTKESDVYSFGIVFLELLTGRRPVMFTEDEDIVKWVKRQLQRGQISELLEPGLLELDPESSEWEEFLLGVKKVPAKIHPTTSYRKRLIEEREDLSHPNFNQLPRVLAKRSKTESSRAKESGSVPQVAVTPEEVQDVEIPFTSGDDSQTIVYSTDFVYHNAAAPASDTPQYEHFLNPIVEEQEHGTRTTDEEGIQDDNNNDSSELEADEYGPRDTYMLTSFQTHRAKTLAFGQDPGCLRVFHHSPTWDIGREVEKAGGAGISLSLVKMVDFFAYKVGRNAHDPDAAETSSSSEPPKLSSRAVAKAYMFLGAYLRVSAKALACCTTLLEFWIFEYFPKLHGIPKHNDSRAPEYCTRWSWSRTTNDRSGEKALNIFREALDNYKLEDVVWDPYLEKRADRHVFKKVVSFTNFICSPEHIEAYYPDRVQRQFNRRQYVHRNLICLDNTGLRFAIKPCAYKPNYDWADLFSGGKWRDSLITTRGRKYMMESLPVLKDTLKGSKEFHSPNLPYCC